ncbi:MAG TPA: site-2 protease family protein [Planctomycetaceae bacterium]|jgi:putative peptide zinc metalloprotease protein
MTAISSAASAAVSERPVPLRARPDLVIQPLAHRDRVRWRLKDPVSLEYFQLEDEEYAILTMLDGRASLAQIKRQFDDRFAPRHVSLPQLQAYLAHLHHEGLALAEASGQGESLLARKRSADRRLLAAALANPLAIRFRGVDPDGFLRWLYPRVRWMLSGWFGMACVIVLLAAGALVVTQFEGLVARLPEFRAFLTPSGLAWLAVVLAGIKVLHELGHALACRHFGGECHEMGVLLLVFTPCLYCNVSDAWMFPAKWPRIAISAAGIAVEVVLAAGCLFLWYFSEPGLVNSILFDVVLVSSVGTLVFNGNPLLRYDGYYILSDALDLPNLAEKSNLLLKRTLLGWIAGAPRDGDSRLPSGRRGWLFAYALLSAVYRLFVLSMILWFCWRVFAEWDLKILGGGLIMIVIAGMAAPPGIAVVRFLSDPARRRQLDPLRLRWSLVLAGCLIAAAALFPVPQWVAADAVLQAAGAQRVHVTVAGRLLESVEPGTAVRKGDVVARLDSQPLRREIEKLTAERDLLALRCHNLDSRRADDSEAAAQIPAAAEELAEAEASLAQRQDDARRLTLTAPVAGTVLPPPDVPESRRSLGELPHWSRTPLEERNIGSWLEAGTAVCIIGKPREFEALLVIGQSEIELVRIGQAVRIQLDQLPGTILHGKVSELSALNLESVPPELIGAHDTATRQDRSGNLRPAETSYQARVTLPVKDLPVLLRARGRAKISVDPVPLGRQLYRLLRQTFHFKL